MTFITTALGLCAVGFIIFTVRFFRGEWEHCRDCDGPCTGTDTVDIKNMCCIHYLELDPFMHTTHTI